MATWRIDSSTDPQGIDDIFAERQADKNALHGDERIDRRGIEQRLKERDWLVELAAGITEIVHTGDTKRVDEAWIAMSTDLQKEINFKEGGEEGEVRSGPLPYTAGRLGP